MTGPDDPQYPDQSHPAPQPAYPPGAYPPPPAAAYPPYQPAEPQRRAGLLGALGALGGLGVSLSGAGIGLIIIGIIDRFLGALLALLVVVAGHLLAIRTVRGPLASAGVVAGSLGLVVGGCAARYGRRSTTWVSTSGAAFGAVLVVVKIADDNTTAGGIGPIIVGAAVVAASSAVAKALREPDDMAAVARSVRAA